MAVQDIYDPLESFTKEFSPRFSKVTAETFDELVKVSKVDVEQNKLTVQEIYAKEIDQGEIERRISFFRNWIIFLWVLIGIGTFAAIIQKDVRPEITYLTIVVIVVLLIIMILGLYPRKRQAQETFDAYEDILNNLKQKGLKELAPLTSLFDWDITLRMISKTVPRISFDPYFSEGRLSDLENTFGLERFNDDTSVLYANSGEINGNSFVFGRVLCKTWGTKIYTAQKTIRVRVGKQYVYETLTASVEKPIPVFFEESFLIYGNDAAPNLSFFRESSGLAQKEDSFFGRLEKKRELKKLQKFSRNLKDDSEYTMMGNSDFEVLFNTASRDNEVEFRLLFTPVAQRQMLDLLRDKGIGFGDDFSFEKDEKINIIRADHLENLDFNHDPKRYRHYNLTEMQRIFKQYNEDYFRSIYFAFAPLLAIPAYQQIRTHEDIYKGVYSKKSSYFEHEALANFYGSSSFKHPDCITRSILKTSVINKTKKSNTIKVSAHGYSSRVRYETVSVWGGGRYHYIRVPWDEYTEVVGTRNLYCNEDFTEKEMTPLERSEHIQCEMYEHDADYYRRSMTSSL